MNKSKKNAYLVLEVETGLMDGWYCCETLEDGSPVDAMREHWNSLRPRYKHLLLKLDGGRDNIWPIPDNVWLTEHHYHRPTRERLEWNQLKNSHE